MICKSMTLKVFLAPIFELFITCVKWEDTQELYTVVQFESSPSPTVTDSLKTSVVASPTD